MRVTDKLAGQVVLACEYFDVKQVIISPGSRNAPLTISFSSNPKFDSMSIVDERCAGFFALGIAQQTNKPVVLVCTSGSALLNYYPAIAEAYYSNISLIIISADRPKHLIDIGDGQTINQENVFENHIGYNANLVEGEESSLDNSKLLITAFKTSIKDKKPVHINVPFDEPLYNLIEDDFKITNFETIVNKFNTAGKLDSSTLTNNINIDFCKLKTTWNKSVKKLILVGVNAPCKELQVILSDLVAKDPSVLVMTESTSNLYNDRFINSIDQLISNFDKERFKELQPDVLITLGGFVISKRIKQFLRNYKPNHHWHVDLYKELDTYFSLTEYVKLSPVVFFDELLKKTIKASSNYQFKFNKQKNILKQKHNKFLVTAVFSDLVAISSVVANLPINCQLQVSNSSMIRYLQLLDLNNTLSVFCNRGTSGIDGSTSTAIGASLINKNQTVFLTGDISFFYDSNALWNNYIPNDFRIILLNNDGGGIFKIIQGPKKSGAISFFETKHGLTAEHLAKMYGFEYRSAMSLGELDSCLKGFYEFSEQPRILEVFTPSDKNDTVLSAYFDYLN